MRTKLVLLVSAVMVLGLVIGGVAFGSGSSRIITAPEEIHVGARFTNFRYVDNKPVGKDSIGDEVVIRAELFGGGVRAGTASIKCTSVFFDHLQCQIISELKSRGKVVAEGWFADAQRIHAVLAVTGGTGHSRNTRGVLEVDDNGPNTSAFVFHLIP